MSFDANKPIEILLVEDNPGDVRLTKEAVAQSTIRNNLNAVNNGAEAMAFLRREGKYADASRPDLILLDLNLPGMDGREVLAEVKKDENLRRIPVVILSTSQEDDDIVQAFDLRVYCYVTKPINTDQLLKIVKSVREYWSTINKKPVE